MTTLWAFAVAIAVLVVFHELGHYCVARLCGVKVLRFSVGFGKALYIKKFAGGETEWVISAIPLGGYVKMLDEREGEVAAHELHRAGAAAHGYCGSRAGGEFVVGHHFVLGAMHTRGAGAEAHIGRGSAANTCRRRAIARAGNHTQH